MSAMIVSGLLVAALSAVAASARAQGNEADRCRGRFLAGSLMDEIIQLDYRDPDPSRAASFGVDPGETRATFDDVDDYNDLQESAITFKDGSALPGLAGWTRTVSIAWAPQGELNAVSTQETGCKRITVKVFRGGVPVAQRVAVRTDPG